MRPEIRATLVLPIATALVLAACSGSQSETTAAAEPQEERGDLPPGHPPLDQPGTTTMLPPPVTQPGSALIWTKPAEWTEEPPANPMRQAQYRVDGPGGDGQCVVYYFGAGQGGGPVANAERWADQFDQPDGGSSREVMQTAQIEAHGLPVLTVELTGTYKEGGMMMTGAPEQQRPGYMLLGAVVEGPDANWFFKFTGPEETVRANAERFRELIASVQGPA